jgi:hypothetical protein
MCCPEHNIKPCWCVARNLIAILQYRHEHETAARKCISWAGRYGIVSLVAGLGIGVVTVMMCPYDHVSIPVCSDSRKGNEYDAGNGVLKKSDG